MYEMRSAWHTAVIMKCQVCLWCQIVIIITVNTILFGVLLDEVAAATHKFKKQVCPNGLTANSFP